MIQAVNSSQSFFDPDIIEVSEIAEEVTEAISGIEFIKNLISPNRKFAKDVEKDKHGRIIVDLTNPHILEDMDYFRPSALHFMEHGCYTFYTPNRHPRSEYVKFWQEEKRRCLEGYVRESDGEWVPGYYYFYLNYSPILLTKELEKSEDSENVRAERVREFARVWDGDYLYFHYLEQAEQRGRFCSVLKTRGRGFSFKGGAMGPRNCLLIPESKNYMMAHDKDYLDEDGIWNKSMDTLDWCAEHTPFPRLRYKNKQSELHVVCGYVPKGSDELKGMKSELMGISFNYNSDKARGKRGKLIQWEESGKFPGLLDAWGIAVKSLKQGSMVYGNMVAFGTGGSDEADFEALETLFRSPDANNIYGIPNVFDKNVSSEDMVGFFSPEYMNREYCYDGNGNSDVIKALIEIATNRYKIKHGNRDPFAIVREKAESPITPAEAMMRKTGTFFPVADLSELLTDIRVNESKFVAPHYVGDLGLNHGEVKWKFSDKTPIRMFPLTGKNKEGCIEIFNQPQKGTNGNVNPTRYIMGVDTYDDDFSTTTSLGSVFVFDLWTDKIVAEYTGRPHLARDFYEIVRRLAIYYNAKVNYENNKKGLLAYFRNKNSLQYLEQTPDILKDKELVKTSGYGNNTYGTPATKQVNRWALELQAEWMQMQIDKPLDKQYEIEDGAIVEKVDENMVILRNMDKIRSIAYIEECIKWNPDGNFDRVSAMGMVMILRENRLLRLETDMSVRQKRNSRHDDFLKKMFR